MNVQYLHVQGIMYELKLRTSRNQGQPERREAPQVDNFTSALWTPKVLVVRDHTFTSVRSWAAHTCCVSMIHFVGDIIEKSNFFFFLFLNLQLTSLLQIKSVWQNILSPHPSSRKVATPLFFNLGAVTLHGVKRNSNVAIWNGKKKRLIQIFSRQIIIHF